MSRNLESGAPRNLESGVQRVIEEDVHYGETGRSLSVVATPAATTQADFKNKLLGVSINAVVTGVDNKHSPGHYADTNLPVVIGCSVTTTNRIASKDLVRPLSIASTVTGTGLKKFNATGRSLNITATTTATIRRKRHETAYLPITSTVTALDNKWAITVLSDAEVLYLGSAAVSRVYCGAAQVWP